MDIDENHDEAVKEVNIEAAEDEASLDETSNTTILTQEKITGNNEATFETNREADGTDINQRRRGDVWYDTRIK